MSYSELLEKHERLRAQLESAYACREWDSERIDRIADQIMEVEFNLAGGKVAMGRCLRASVLANMTS